MELSKRMRAVAGLVSRGGRLADIGTDHAYIPIYLVETGAVSEALAMDVNEGPLERAKENIAAHGLEEKIRTRLSDGLSALQPGEADKIVIAGMGGALMMRILRESEEIVASLRECVLQPQSDIEKVRAFLLEKGFFFIDEEMEVEDGKYYFIMKVMPPGKMQTERGGEEEWQDVELKYGKILLRKRHPVLRDYLMREEKIRQNILRKLEEQDSSRAAQRIEEVAGELRCIRKGLDYYAL